MKYFGICSEIAWAIPLYWDLSLGKAHWEDEEIVGKRQNEKKVWSVSDFLPAHIW